MLTAYQSQAGADTLVLYCTCARNRTLAIHPVDTLWRTIVQNMHKLHTIVMDSQSATIRTYFSKLGLSPEIADIYLALHASGPQSISELSRTSRVERTRIYRLLDALMESNLVEVENYNKRGIIRAAPIANLNILINKREQELKNLQDELSLIEQVLARNSLSSPSARVQFYSGPEGIKQMFWNQTKANATIRSITVGDIWTNTDNRFLERWVGACNKANSQFQSIFRESPSQELYEQYTKTSPIKWQRRYIEDAVFDIKQNTVVYDNVVSYFNQEDDQLFGIEIYNSDIADMQLQFFDMLWQKAKPPTA